LFLLFIEETSLGQILSKEALHPKGSGGPNQGAEMGQIRVPKSFSRSETSGQGQGGWLFQPPCLRSP